jgi:hypothetical protein
MVKKADRQQKNENITIDRDDGVEEKRARREEKEIRQKQ